jgi:hypothetical protein
MPLCAQAISFSELGAKATADCRTGKGDATHPKTRRALNERKKATKYGPF